MFQVLVVCTGNTCRSPMAEGILRSLLPEEIAGAVRVSSAGTAALRGSPASALAVQTSAEEGIEIRSHRARELTPAIVLQSDLILVMEPQHAARVRELDPGSSDRVHIITEQGLNPGGTTTSVADPIGGSADQYRDTFNRMRSHLLEWVSVIRDAVERREGVR